MFEQNLILEGALRLPDLCRLSLLITGPKINTHELLPAYFANVKLRVSLGRAWLGIGETEL